jgi:hypothetical protein
MISRRMMSPAVLILFLAVTAATTTTYAAERAAPSEGARRTHAEVDDRSRAGSPLSDIPLRTRHPSRTFLPALPEVGFADPGSSLAKSDETQVIQLVYDTYSQYSEREDGERVEFELDGFRTVYREQLARVAYHPDLVSLASGWKLKAKIFGYSENGASRRVRYDVEWVPGIDLDDRPDLRAFLGMPALEMLALVAERHPEWRRTVAITSYRVRASYLGRVETYRAGFAWMIGEGGELEMTVADAVVPELSFAVLEGDLPAAEHERRAELPFDRAAAASTTNSCVSHTWPTVNSTQQARYNNFEHTSGRHEAVYIGAFDCSCDTTCLSRCDPGFAVAACQDYGDLQYLGLLHEPSERAEVAGSQSQDGHLNGAQCASGLGCFVKSCIGSSCGGVAITLSGGIGGLTFTTSATTILDASLTYSHICARCTEHDPDDSETPSDGPILQPCDPDCGSPIVVDLDRGGFRFTDLAGGVRFDLDGDGHAEQVAWIAPGSGDGWLVLDRDGDGLITSGAELFGNFTPQPPSDEPHGYAALAVFDQPAAGGDGDGAITPADAVFAELRLWIDADHDGVSQPGELIPLAAAGIRAIDLGFVNSAHRDEHGNELRYASRVRLSRGATRSADVFLLTGD